MLQSSGEEEEVVSPQNVSPSSSIESVWEGDDYQYVTEEEEIGEIGGGWIKFPSRTSALTLLSSDYRRRLRENVSQAIIENEAAPCLSIERFCLVLETHPVLGSYFMSDSNGYLFLYWLTQGPGNKYIVDEENRRRLKLVVGPIRDQLEHLICWAYAICDLISSCRVLHGLDKEFLPLSPMFLCRNVYQKYYTEKCKAENVEEHCCLSGSILEGLIYAKMYGIPREKPEERVFDCSDISKEFINGDEELYKISEVFEYETLELALERVQTGYPVAASLMLFEGWGQAWQGNDQPTYIYNGPQSGGKYLSRRHIVIIVDFKVINGIKVAICKSSNGEGNHNRGYIAVNVEIMITLVGATKRKGDPNFCKDKPEYLLADFFSIDMEMGPDPLIKVEPDRAKENMKFKVETDCVRHLLAPKYGSPLTAGLVVEGTQSNAASDKSKAVQGEKAGLDPQVSVSEEVVKPCGRINSCMVVGKDTLYIYGGMMEIKDKEITLDDLYSLNLSKLDEWQCIIPATETEWVEVSEDEEGDEDEDEDDSDDEGNSEESDDDDEVEAMDVYGSVKVGEVVAMIKGEGKSLRRKEKRARIEQIRANLGLSDSQRTPAPGETLKDFYNRTNMYWQMAAYEHTQHTGKELRKDGFDLSETRYLELQPILDELAILEAEQKAEEAEASSSSRKGGNAKKKR